MLYLSTKLKNIGLYTVRLGGKIGTITRPIINPHNLHIDGFYCAIPKTQEEQIVLDMDIRDLSLKGVIINDHEDISAPEDLVRLTEIIEINYELVGKSVFANGKRIGKVTDYAIDDTSLFVKKIFVQPPIWRTFISTDLVIDRQSILEVTESKIVVSGPESKVENEVESSAKINQSFSPASNAFTRE
jgi:sporulation protein YlmC with PRC-barrel domain